MRIIHYPDYTNTNPYQKLLFAALRAEGFVIRTFRGKTRSLTAKALRHRHYDILHLHWIDMPVTRGSLAHAVASMALFYATLMIFKLRGTTIFWTVHNLTNHDKRRVHMDRFHARCVGKLADRILVHGDSARDSVVLALRCKPDKVSVVHHGNYDGAISATPLDEEHEGRRFLFVGRIELYKGLDGLLEVFPRLEGPHRLHVAGRASDVDLKTRLAHLSDADDRISHDLTFIPSEELERLLAWCDVIVLPYRDIFTSGSLLMSLTAGRPVIAPRLGLIPEYVDDDAAFLYDPKDETALLGALEAAVADLHLGARAAAARRNADRFAWPEIGAHLASLYRQARGAEA